MQNKHPIDALVEFSERLGYPPLDEERLAQMRAHLDEPVSNDEVVGWKPPHVNGIINADSDEEFVRALQDAYNG